MSAVVMGCTYTQMYTHRCWGHTLSGEPPRRLIPHHRLGTPWEKTCFTQPGTSAGISPPIGHHFISCGPDSSSEESGCCLCGWRQLDLLGKGNPFERFETPACTATHRQVNALSMSFQGSGPMSAVVGWELFVSLDLDRFERGCGMLRYHIHIHVFVATAAMSR